MKIKRIKVQLDSGAFPPESAHTADAGYDLRTPTDFIVRAGESTIVDTGIHIAIPEGYVGFLKSKSGLNVKHNLTGEGVIDAGYTGSIVVKLFNHSTENGSFRDKYFKRGDKIIQLVLIPIIKPDIVIVRELKETERGNGGFGSTGR